MRSWREGARPGSWENHPVSSEEDQENVVPRETVGDSVTRKELVNCSKCWWELRKIMTEKHLLNSATWRLLTKVTSVLGGNNTIWEVSMWLWQGAEKLGGLFNTGMLKDKRRHIEEILKYIWSKNVCMGLRQQDVVKNRPRTRVRGET